MAPELRNSGLIQALTDLFGDFADLLRKELQLAKTEVTEESQREFSPLPAPIIHSHSDDPRRPRSPGPHSARGGRFLVRGDIGRQGLFRLVANP